MLQSPPRHNSPSRDRRAVERVFIKTALELNASLDLDGVCGAVLDAVEAIFGATSSWILLHDPQIDRLKTRAFRGDGSRAYEDVTLPPSVGILGLAFTSRQIVFVPDAQTDHRWFDPSRVHRSGLRSVLTVPLLHHGGVAGIVGLDSPRFGAERPPRPDDITRLEALAAQAAIAVVNARLYEQSERDRHRLRLLLQERRTPRRRVAQIQDDSRGAHPFGNIVSESEIFGAAVNQASLVAPADTTVLLLGETGTGKELLARLIHARSARAQAPFVAVNCAALPESLVESELFGHEKGAFTGAMNRKLGKFELAHGGSLFLDEIGDLPPDAQAKLLRVLQDSEVQRVGATGGTTVNVRVIAATNQNLETAIEERRFRSDLYYRLSVFPIEVPPLRARAGDVDVLTRHFVSAFAAKLRKPIMSIDQQALDRLRAYPWPGNVRELQNVIERAVILSPGPSIEAETLVLPERSAFRRTKPTERPGSADGESTSQDGASAPAPRQPASENSGAGVPHTGVMLLADAERQAIHRALEAARWRISGSDGAARLLGLPPTTLHAKMKKLGIRRHM
jgi:formate hydrogenlyase transcriptional activator